MRARPYKTRGFLHVGTLYSVGQPDVNEAPEEVEKRHDRAVVPLIAKLSAGKATLSLAQVKAPQGAGKPEGLLARGFAAIKGETLPGPAADLETLAALNPTNHK